MRVHHKCKTTDGRTVTTPMAMGQIWMYLGDRYVVDRVFVKKVRFDRGTFWFTVDQKQFVRHAQLLVPNP